MTSAVEYRQALLFENCHIFLCNFSRLCHCIVTRFVNVVLSRGLKTNKQTNGLTHSSRISPRVPVPGAAALWCAREWERRVGGLSSWHHAIGATSAVVEEVIPTEGPPTRAAGNYYTLRRVRYRIE